jgi:hypothetical protein
MKWYSLTPRDGYRGHLDSVVRREPTALSVFALQGWASLEKLSYGNILELSNAPDSAFFTTDILAERAGQTSIYLRYYLH